MVKPRLRVITGGGRSPAPSRHRRPRPFTGVTRPEPSGLGEENAQGLVEASLRRYGRPRARVEAEIESRLSTYAAPAPDRGKVAAGRDRVGARARR
jgi:hypothetical protein